ncbi:hypothetical protein BCR36DRAFT_579003 [Piromyces finnis]|uniref:PHD-type domain-containing protein n=1 Tax=Piromyces finnis TaxID=1754191 RepID=A0A1Y1VNC6_9FUNG|nr:hypothetical protein BCR36DRAFT_579003 [Piromyces finnis]|eukprot:ORX60928.1 hypothetical protein BCR36DRAFT_579003 [Piromyces finnis]
MSNISDDEGSAVTQCICGKNSPHYDGLMIQCEDCGVWQHGACVNITKKNTPKNYYCQKCRPEYHPYNSHLLNKSKKASNNPNSPPSKSYSQLTSSPKKRNTMNSLEASQNYNAILNLNANISSGESEPSSTTNGKKKRKATRNFSQDLSYSSNNSDGSIEKAKKIRKVHSEYDNNDNGSKLKDSVNKDSRRHHKSSHKAYDDDDYDEMDDIDDIEDDNDDDDYIPRGDGKTSRNLFNKKHDNNSLRKSKFELGDESDHGKIKIKKDDPVYDDKSGGKKSDLIKQEDSIKIKKERKGSKLNIELSLPLDPKQDIKSEDKTTNGINDKISKNKRNLMNDSHLLKSLELGDIENSGRSPTPNRKSSIRNTRNSNDTEDSKSDLYNSSTYRNGYDDIDSLNQNTNSSSNTTNIHISKRHSTRNSHRINYQQSSMITHSSSHHKSSSSSNSTTTIKVKYPNQKASIHEMNKRAKQILEYLNRTRDEIKELYRKNRLNSKIQSGEKVDIKEYKNEGKYSEDMITDNADSMTSFSENDDSNNGLEMLEKLCLKITKFQKEYYI